MSLRPGDLFGRYEITELLGQGGMGEVYRAQDTLLHRRVALKILHPAAPGTGSGGSQTDGAARILREARAAAGIEHPNAISIYDVGEVDGVPFLAMEFIAGRTLRHFIGDKSISTGRRIRWLVDIARALAAAHQLGLVHRDIKPENVMVRDDGVVKVLDFGIARRTASKTDPTAATEAPSIATLTAAGVVVGTPFYMPPEQMRGEALDGRADQFAWGVLAYELLTGSRPWDNLGDGLQLVSQILSREVDPPRSRNGEIPPAVDAAIRTALAKTPAGRFEHMRDLADVLEPYAAGGGVATGRAEVRISAQTDPISLAPTQAAPSGSSATSIPSTRTQLATGPAPSVAPPAKNRWPTIGAAVIAVALGGFVVSRFLSPHAKDTGSAPDAAPAPATESQMSSNPQATAAYRAGMRAFRDGSLDLAAEQFTTALELDPTFAAAHLRRALLPYEQRMPTTNGDVESARSARDSLGERERVLLDALEPSMRVPSDLRESGRRFEAALAHDPSNADLAFQVGWTAFDVYESAKADSAFDTTIKIDPTFAMAWRMKGRTRVLMNDTAGANEAYRRCLEVSPSATSCLDDLATLQANEGDCAGMATTLRRLIAIAPNAPASYQRLAQALFGTGESIDAVKASLAQGWEKIPEAWGHFQRFLDERQLAAVTGHFDEAARSDAALEKLAATWTADLVHYSIAYERILANLELGRQADAASLAKDYLRRRSAWQSDGVQTDMSIAVSALQRRAGGLSSAEFEKIRSAWLTAEHTRIGRVGLVASAYAGPQWALAYALPVANSEEAAAAIAARPKVDPLLDGWTDSPDFDEPIGRAYLLAGDADGAIPFLERASRSCSMLAPFAPEFTTWAAAELGQAYESKGETAQACAAYRRVVARWGDAKPPSLTARRARERERALKCDP